MVLRLVFALFTILLFFISSGYGGENWYEISSPHFLIYYHPRDEKPARYTARVAEEIYPGILRDLNCQMRQRTKIYLCRDEQEIFRIAGSYIPHWAIGGAFFPQGSILVLSPTTVKTRVDLRELVAHEFTHIALREKIGEAGIPRWFEEGLAMHEARQWNPAWEEEVKGALLRKELISLSRLEGSFSFPQDKVVLAYAQSLSVFDFLLKKIGKGNLSSFLEAIRRKGSLEKALEKDLGMNTQKLEEEWKNSLKKGSSPFLLFDYRLFPFILLGMIFLIVYLIRRYRNKKIIQEWEEQSIT